MNLCILLGKIVSEIEFKFILNSKHKSIAYFDLELSNKSIVKIKAYDEVADYVYRRIQRGEFIVVNGKVREKCKVEVEMVLRLDKHNQKMHIPNLTLKRKH